MSATLCLARKPRPAAVCGLGVAALLALSGCNLAPQHQTPALAVPAQVTPANAAPTAQGAEFSTPPALALADWVQDQRLRQLVAQALNQSRNLQQAVLNVERARALYGISQANQLPTIGLSAQAARSRTSADLSSSGQPVVQNQFTVQLGLTATPKRKDNADTYAYFGEPVFIYSLKDGINDGFLTPFRLKQIATTLDDYVFTSDDTVVEGEIEAGKRYEEKDFNKIIEIKAREKKRVEIFMNEIDQREKTIVFCATQLHALAVRDLHMTMDEALQAATLGGAQALRRNDIGVLAAGCRADMVVLDAPSYTHLVYRPGVPLIRSVIEGGRPT